MLNSTNPCITQFRSLVASILRREANALLPKHIVILAVDGIPYDLAAQVWCHAELHKMQSVFPTTSSSAWLSALTGLHVKDHGIPGVIFKLNKNDKALINIYEHKEPIFTPITENIFSDANALGYTPISISGDLIDCNCIWRDWLLKYSKIIKGERYFTDNTLLEKATKTPTLINETIFQSITKTIHSQMKIKKPALIWCFIEADRYIHHHGYDNYLIEFLISFERMAIRLAEANTIVLAHSDHGLKKTTHHLGIETAFNRAINFFNCPMGGAGRTRWFYAEHNIPKVVKYLKKVLPTSIKVVPSNHYFHMHDLSYSRVGHIMVVAEEEEFILPSPYQYEHGSLTEEECFVPHAIWQTENQ